MDTIVFDGRAFAEEKQKKLKKKVSDLKRKRIFPKMVTILIGDDPASKLFVDKKKQMGDRVGVDVEIIKLKSSVSVKQIIQYINKYNNEYSTRGIMVQLPLPKRFSKKDREKIINSILKEKDVDGMRSDSSYLTPTVKSVLYVLKEAFGHIVPFDGFRVNSSTGDDEILVVGHTGFEGKKIYRVLKEMGYKVTGADLKTKNLKEKTISADILISVTGVCDLIKGNMVKQGCVLIDVGAPDGDIEKEAYKKACFVSPVPGGIGPVTIMFLLENLIEACR